MSKKFPIVTDDIILCVGVENRVLRRITEDWVKHVVRVGEIRNRTFLAVNPKGIGSMRGLVVDGETMWTGLNRLTIRSSGGDEPCCSVKGGVFLVHLNHYQLLNKGCAPCSYVLSYHCIESLLMSAPTNPVKCDTGTNGRMWLDGRAFVFLLFVGL